MTYSVLHGYGYSHRCRYGYKYLYPHNTCTCKGTLPTTPTSAHLRSPPTYIHISLLSVPSYTYYYSLSSPTSPTFGDVAVHIPFPSSSFHTVPFPFSMIL